MRPLLPSLTVVIREVPTMARLVVPLKRSLWERWETRLSHLDWELVAAILWGLVVIGVLIAAYYSLAMVANGNWPA